MQQPSTATPLGNFFYEVDAAAPFAARVWANGQPEQECWLQPHQPDGSDWPDQATATTWATAQINLVINAVDETAINQTQLDTLTAGLSAQITQAQSDLTTLAASTDPLAPILARCIEGILGVAQGLASIGVLGGHVDPTRVPKI